jgi:hypothetical protein
LRLAERRAHEQSILLRAVRCIVPSATRRFEPRAPSQELALGRDPLAQLVPTAEDRTVASFRVKMRRSVSSESGSSAINLSAREGEEPTRRRATRSEFTDKEWGLVSELADQRYRLLASCATSA